MVEKSMKKIKDRLADRQTDRNRTKNDHNYVAVYCNNTCSSAIHTGTVTFASSKWQCFVF